MMRSSRSRTTSTVLAGCLLGSIVAGLVACADVEPTGIDEPVGTEEPQELPQGLLLSEPGGASASGTAAAASDSPAAWISARPGTFPGATEVEVTNQTTGAPALMVVAVEGGFDPVAVHASAGDEIELDVRGIEGRISLLVMEVPEARPPIVVRTDPPKGRTDVAFLVQPDVVFSEPIDASSLEEGSVRLLRDGSPVPARVGVVPESPFTARLVPGTPLQPSTTYELVVSTAVHDLEGDALEEGLSVTFTTRAITPTLSIVSGDGQQGRVGMPLADSLVVRVSDADGTALENVPVLWEAWGSGGALDGFADDGAPVDTLRTRTDADGLARVLLVPTAFSLVRTEARLLECPSGCDVSSVTFTADARDPGVTVSVVSGDDQTADAGRASAPLVVRVTDAEGNPVQHALIRWEKAYGQASFSDSILAGTTNARTDADGLAQASIVPLWFAPVNVEVYGEGLPGPSAFFEIDASDPGASIAIVSGDGQVGKANEPLGNPLVVRVTNGRGDPVERVRIDWSGGPSWGSAYLPLRHFDDPGSSVLVAGLDSVYYTPRAGGPVWATASLPGFPAQHVGFTAEATAFVIELVPPEGYTVPSAAFTANTFDEGGCWWWPCGDENWVRVGVPVEWVIRVPSGRIVATSVPAEGTPFDSGTLAEDDRFSFVPNVAGRWEYADSLSGATAVLTVH